MSNMNYHLVFAAALLWIGFLGAIRFMEASLKFRAPPLGLLILGAWCFMQSTKCSG